MNSVFQTFTGNQGYYNNKCSGFALAPILMEACKSQLLPAVTHDANLLGNWIYENLCLSQRTVLSGYVKQNISVRFVESPFNMIYGTCMVLPSIIVNYCHDLGLCPEMVYFARSESIFGEEVFDDDCARMKNFLCPVDDYEGLERQTARYCYWVALTKFKHWVSLKATTEGYYLYDPAPEEFRGGVFGPGSFGDMLPEIDVQTGNKFFNGIAIGLCPNL